MNASLNERLQNVEWGEYKLEKLFEKIKVNKLKYKTKDLPNHKTPEYSLPALTAGIENQGLNNYVPNVGATVLKNVISISANGANTGATFYQNKEFTVLQDAYALKWIFDNTVLSDNQYLFLTSSISKTVYGNYEWTNKAGWERIKTESIMLPVNTDGKIDFDFMESFIAELEAERVAELAAYLKVSGADNYELSDEERDVLHSFDNLQFGEFTYENIFNNIVQGRRLKKDDQRRGSIPFVMAGRTNTGIVNYVSNPIASFPENSITVDIFGNTFYRSYAFGAGDDTGVYWNSEMKYSKDTMLFLATAMEKSIAGKFSYGKKLRSSQSRNIKMKLPIKDGAIDFDFMETLIRAVKKLVIKDVVLYSERKINAAKYAVKDMK